MEDIKKLSNAEILEQIKILSQNHEQVKGEVILLHQVLMNIEGQYIELSEELKNRK